eukprot:CAMPEP_0181183942 /NCGR_PEP_ID=MMETSP1096-20121128/8701_1 /TAXON_ID=156174 ORGANISM="Chrysochromulina ericina, Strain CCMP281" /NCGR_SAMPLE_ID=MMETSP1096 /ASSEMBLY_ACC=CAM_ASM_000453 /LENGTH=32 /DNA_ID= /DNA_START= /DNA_END= /DNA_ORIENTATION=
MAGRCAPGLKLTQQRAQRRALEQQKAACRVRR